MTSVLKMTDLNLTGKRVLIRQDLNVPIKDGHISSDKRLQASLPTLKQALATGAKVIVMSHLGRPEEGVYDAQFSLRPIADYLQQHLQVPVDFVEHDATPPAAQSGRLMLLENVRFNKGEKKNEDALAQRMAALCDIYVMDAFGTAHRAQASTHGVAKYAPVACAGPLLWAELEALSKVLENPRRPMLAIVGGAKVSSKLTILEALSKKVDQLIVGGGIANTFIAAAGYTVGKSLYEAELIETARSLSAQTQARGADIPVPTDVVCGKAFSADAAAQLKRVNAVAEDDMIFDIGPETAETFIRLIHEAGTIIWNGPVGVFEFAQFGEGTRALAHAIAESAAFSIAGGGDTLAAIEKYGIEDRLSYISTGGGAFLEFLEGKALPAVEILEHRAQALKHRAQAPKQRAQAPKQRAQAPKQRAQLKE